MAFQRRRARTSTSTACSTAPPTGRRRFTGTTTGRTSAWIRPALEGIRRDFPPGPRMSRARPTTPGRPTTPAAWKARGAGFPLTAVASAVYGYRSADTAAVPTPVRMVARKDAPCAVADAYTTSKGAATTASAAGIVGLLANDTDADSSPNQ